MKRILLRRPTTQMWLPTGLLLIDAVCAILVARAVNFWLLGVVGIICAILAAIVALAWKGFRYELCSAPGHHNGRPPLILIERIGFFYYTERHIPLDDLEEIIMKRPMVSWCDAANITLCFVNGVVFNMGMVSHASKGIELLYTAMPLRQRSRNIPAEEYDAVTAWAA